MLNLVDELSNLVRGFEEHHIEYALCGGMAMGVHGRTRATIDIDLVILSESWFGVLELAKTLGYNIRGKDLSFADGAIEIRRVSKVDPEDNDLLTLDFLLVTPDILDVWESRQQIEWENGKLSVVSKAGLISLKQLRSSFQDLADIQALESEDAYDEG